MIFRASDIGRRAPGFRRKRREKRKGFFSKEKTEARREFRVEVSGNRKWIMIGLAVVVACGTAIYFSIAYGGGISGVMNFVGKLREFF